MGIFGPAIGLITTLIKGRIYCLAHRRCLINGACHNDPHLLVSFLSEWESLNGGVI